MKSMTTKDAELLFRWLCRHYGYPGELEKPAVPPLAQRGNRHRDHPADDKSDRRMRRHKDRTITIATIARETNDP
jgi:hypothetical protein